MTPAGLAFCIGLPLLFAALAVFVHLTSCQNEELQVAAASRVDPARLHYSRLPAFIDGQDWPTNPELGDLK